MCSSDLGHYNISNDGGVDKYVRLPLQHEVDEYTKLHADALKKIVSSNHPNKIVALS